MNKVVYQKCPFCEGVGKREYNTKSLEVNRQAKYKTVSQYIKCFECNGTGKIETAYFVEV